MTYSTLFEFWFFETNIISSNPKLFTVKYQKSKETWHLATRMLMDQAKFILLFGQSGRK